MMNRKYRIVCLLALLASGGPIATAATLSVTGRVLENTCEVDVASKDFTVNLGSNSSKQFWRVGDQSVPVMFNIVFLRCDAAAQKVKVGFTGTADGDNSSLLKNSASGASAGGIGIKIQDKNMNDIPLNSAQSALNWTELTAGQRNVLTFYSRMVSTRSPVTAGRVNGTATFTLEYF